MNISGTVKYQELEGGFWSIIGKNGEEYKPINMPNQLMYDGAKVKISAVPYEGMSMSMWGSLIKIISFQTMMP